MKQKIEPATEPFAEIIDVTWNPNTCDLEE